MEITKEGVIATVGGVAAVATILCVINAGRRNEPPAPGPTGGMRTATQGPRTTYPDCRDAEVPCVSRVSGDAWLVTETGARIPAIVVSVDEKSRPRMVTIA